MTTNEFVWWLKGYLHQQTYLGSSQIKEIKEQIDKISEPVQPLGVSSPNWGSSGTITIPGSNVNTTLTVPVTSPQLLKD